MHTASTIVTPPAADPVTLGEVKGWAKIDTTADDGLLAGLITAATQAAEEYLKRSLITQTRKLTIDAGRSDICLPDGVYDLPVSILTGSIPNSIELPFGPLQSITSIVTYGVAGGSTTFSASNYYVDTASNRVTLNYGVQWPSDLRDRKSMEVTYVAGYGNTASAIPAPIKTAIMMHVQRMYDGRLICDMPPECESMLRKYRIYG